MKVQSLQNGSTTGKFPTTPDLPSVIVQSADRPWKATKFPGVEFKLLFEDQSSGLFTGLFRWAPGAELPYHEHAALEQTYVLEGGLIDHEGELTAGGYAARPAGSRHVAKASAAGCLNISFFLRPNLFFDDEGGVKAFER
jgi:anti-sigma factor ChrR (cupin superfamily)